MHFPDSCDTFVALPSVTGDGTVIFGKNSDRHKDEVQEAIYCPASDHPQGEEVQCTYVAIPQVAHTYAMLLSKPSWLWGAEMGSNEKGVVIGNEAVWSKEFDEKESMKEKLLGMDLVRLGLERGGTAKEALDVIAALIADPGQGGPCSETSSSFTYHNSFIIADSTEAWVMETMDKHYAAEKVTEGVRNISNQLSIGTKIDAMSPGLKELAKEKAYWNGKAEFHFANAFSAPIPGSVMKLTGVELPSHRFKCGKILMEAAAKSKGFNVRSMMSVLRDEASGVCRVGHEGPNITTSSYVAVLQPTTSKIPSCHWVTATPNPQCSVFKPFVFCDHVRFGARTVSPKFPDSEDPAKLKPRFSKQVDRRHTLYTAHSSIRPVPGDQADRVICDILRGIENQCINDLQTYLATYDASKPCELCDLFTDAVDSEYKIYMHK